MNHDNVIDTTATEPRAIDPIAVRLDPIRAALAPNAPPEILRAALGPLRALYAEFTAAVDGMPPPRPVAPPAALPPSHPLRGVSVDQILDLAIAQLRPIVGDGGAAAGSSPLGQLLGSLR